MTNQLANIKNFDQLIRYLEDELDWPCQKYGFDEITFKYTPEELGIKDEDSVQIKQIHQLRPFYQGQPWGIFFIEFEKKRLPVALLRRVLSHLVVKKRASANSADKAVWNMDNLLFISAFGDATTETREIAFAHFHQEDGDLPTLKVLGWDGADTVLKMEFVDQELHEKLHWPKDPKNIEVWQSTWSSAFRHKPGFVIKTANALADRLAELARGIRGAAETLMSHESEKGPLRQLYKAFQTALIHDLTEADFADTYAQTITYGLLTAAISRTDMSGGIYGTALVASNVTDLVPITNPFLKEMLETFIHAGDHKGGIQFDELGIQDVVDLLRGEETDLPAVLRDFDNKTPGEDPVIQFYEHFLSAYNKKLKIQRGVFYTPKPVVSYIVRSVDELLKTEFGLEDGLADTTTWGEMEKKIPGLKCPESTDPGSPFVLILDPATGTATFLVEVIEIIFKTLTDKWEKQHLSKSAQNAVWNEYVPKHLLPRMYGFELMMAPYAIAHMKVGLKLFETGYHFGSTERVRIFLTNSLEPATDEKVQQTFSEMVPALAHEAETVNEVKQSINFTVVIGNPPYSYMSANLTTAAANMIESFRYVDGVRIKEKSALSLERSLQDDFVKFLGLSLRLKNRASNAFVLGFITNNSYLDSPLQRGLRDKYSKTFNSLHIINLFGDSIKDHEENVFDIKQGVAILLGCGNQKTASPKIFLSEIHGSRSEKYQYLISENCKTTIFSEINPIPPQRYFFHLDNSDEFISCPAITEIFQLTSTCIKTLKDNLATDFDRGQVIAKLTYFRNLQYSVSDIKAKFGIKDVVQWKVEPARKALKNIELEDFITEYQSRPFDYRWMFYHKSIIGSPRVEVMHNLLDKHNIALITNRKIRTGKCNHFWVTKEICVSEVISSADNSNCFPLYIYDEEGGFNLGDDRRPNYTKSFLNELSKRLNLPQVGEYSLPKDCSSEDIFFYIYGVFHSPAYRERYKDYLQIDFPRLPITSNLNLFHILCTLGKQLVSLHLLESPEFNTTITRFTGNGDNSVQSGYPKYENGRVLINSSQSFESIPQDVWEFQVGVYQVCEKWLKDRRGRQLSEDDITHYQKIIVALKETIRIMGEIDQVIEDHGGWPIK